jgi:hypothetical protein
MGPPVLYRIRSCCAKLLLAFLENRARRWLREDVTNHHCHSSPDDLTRRVATFETRINTDPCALADRLWVMDQLDPKEEELRFPK